MFPSRPPLEPPNCYSAQVTVLVSISGSRPLLCPVGTLFPRSQCWQLLLTHIRAQMPPSQNHFIIPPSNSALRNGEQRFQVSKSGKDVSGVTGNLGKWRPIPYLVSVKKLDPMCVISMFSLEQNSKKNLTLIKSFSELFASSWLDKSRQLFEQLQSYPEILYFKICHPLSSFMQ